MPARSSHAPRTFPCDLIIFLASFPQGKIQRILFDITYSDTCSRFQIFDILSGQFAISVKFTRGEVHISVYFVSISLVHQGADKINDLRYMLGNLRMDVSLSDIQCCCVFIIFLDIFFADLRCRNAFFSGFIDDLVIYIGKVLHEFYFISPVFQIFAERIEYNKRSCVSNVEKVIYRRSANVNFKDSVFDRLQLFFSACHSIIDFHALPPFLLPGCPAEFPLRFLHWFHRRSGSGCHPPSLAGCLDTDSLHDIHEPVLLPVFLR